MESLRALVLDDEEGVRKSISFVLMSKFDVMHTGSPEEAIIYVIQNKIDLLVLDLNLQSDIDGLDVLEAVRRIDPHIGVMIVTAYESVQSAKRAIHLGVEGYMDKPFDVKELLEESLRIAISSHNNRKTEDGVLVKSLSDIRNSLQMIRKSSEFENLIDFTSLLVEAASMSPEHHDGFVKLSLGSIVEDVCRVLSIRDLQIDNDIYVTGNKAILSRAFFNLFSTISPCDNNLSVSVYESEEKGCCAIDVRYDIKKLRDSSDYCFALRAVKNHEGVVLFTDEGIEIMIPICIS